MLCISSVYIAAPNHAEAVTNQDIQNKKDEMNNVKDKRSSVQSKIDESKSKIASLQGKQASVIEQLKNLEATIERTSKGINEKEAKVKKTKADIVALKKKIEEVTKRIEQRNELLKERIQSLQLSGGMVSYLEVLLGSQSFGDFVNRMNAVTTIMEADKAILKEHEADKKLKVEEENKLSDYLKSVEEDLAELKVMKANYENQKKERNQLLTQLKKQEAHAEKEKMALKEQDELLAKQEAAMKRQLKMLEEQKKQEETARRQSQNNHNNNSSQVIPVSDGTFTRPTVGIITTRFEYRWGEFHPGIDIANSAGTPVVAAADGVVFRSYLSSSYGNAIFITHYIDGQVYTTVYAHMSQRVASENQVVHKGDVIGYMGSTGHSTGNHLHFELHRGPWNYQKSNAINPLQYVNF